jgi:hypothetical protein
VGCRNAPQVCPYLVGEPVSGEPGVADAFMPRSRSNQCTNNCFQMPSSKSMFYEAQPKFDSGSESAGRVCRSAKSELGIGTRSTVKGRAEERSFSPVLQNPRNGQHC